ncbi:aminotransferase class V-fold PLP-dependent enzyme [Cellulomonas sp. PhB150]|uniref:aminotransferase class V-fold PLP-dependent enzyme n=1 Tax=Cellulomonas sp. PhB150 TaxID=2485188 RepID=UPI000F464C13|nr:aminotransferase class V-fold PLP-dependent enzyme [Cellulomonas sp. PhB150]ROS31817.1 selenocysteine lyase/cysteine desulfurase [Cellulomonas sp. PhB150]
MDLVDLRAAFAPVPGYLNAATVGLPARATADAMRTAIDDWQQGRADLAVYDAAVAAARSAFARLVRVPTDDVAIAAQTSALVGLVAAALPDGAEVLVVDGDFSSVVFPFLAHADRGVRVRHVAVDELAGAIRPSTAVVAFSLVQSRDGRVADADAVTSAARAAGALTLCDITQAGWLPVDAGQFDLTVCSAYKWLAAPRGTAFATVRPAVLDRLRPLSAGWYAGDDVWGSVYGPHMRLATSARRLDVSPAWLCWVGAAPALELFAAVPPAAVRDHAVGLADAVRRGCGLDPAGSAIVSVPDADGVVARRLGEAGCVVAARGGGVRLAFHVWNDHDDVERALSVLAPGLVPA